MGTVERSGLKPNDSVRPLRGRANAITTETVFLLLFITGLAWIPFWLGSDRLTPWGINAVIFPCLAALYELSLIIRGLPHPVAIRWIRPSAILFAMAITWALLQNASWTPTAWHHPVWQLASEVLGRQIPESISVDRDLTALAVIRLMTAASVFWLALQLGFNPRRARFLLWSVVGIVAVYAAVGLFALGLMQDGVVFDEIILGHFVSSTFVNKNHFATFAGIGFTSIVALIQRIYRGELHGHDLRSKIASLLDTMGAKTALPLATAFLILAALLLSGSRGGIISTGLCLLVLVVLSRRGARRFGSNEMALAVFMTLIVGATFIGFGDRLVDRILNQGINDTGRLAADLITIRSVLSAPILGHGYGTFAAAFPMFRDDSIGVWVTWDKLHNTYLEIFQGLGLVFGTMLIVSVLLLVFRCMMGAASQQRDVTIPAVAVSVSVLVGVHALVDFSLQIQAITLTYMAVLGLGVAQATNTRLRPHPSVPRSDNGR
jgi:O-Antigen ligase